jgi:hypothetical protein
MKDAGGAPRNMEMFKGMLRVPLNMKTVKRELFTLGFHYF